MVINEAEGVRRGETSVIMLYLTLSLLYHCLGWDTFRNHRGPTCIFVNRDLSPYKTVLYARHSCVLKHGKCQEKVLSKRTRCIQ